MKNKEIVKIILSMVIALVIAQLSTRTIFMANTPRINKIFIAKLIKLPQSVLKSTQEFIAKNSNKNTVPSTASLNNNLPQNNIPVSAMKEVSKGIYAKEDTENNVFYIHITKDMEFEEKILNYNGKQIKLRFPKGTFK